MIDQPFSTFLEPEKDLTIDSFESANKDGTEFGTEANLSGKAFKSWYLY